LPQALPGLFTAASSASPPADEFLMALTFNDANNFRTIPVVSPTSRELPGSLRTIFAASVVAVVPIGILVFIFRKFGDLRLTSAR